MHYIYLNFIQLKKSAYSNWELDIQGTPGPYYYKLSEINKYSRKNSEGDDVLSLYDAPGGFLSKIDFFTAVVEVSRSCHGGRDSYGFSVIDCYDQVRVVAAVSWSYDPGKSGHYRYSGKQDGVRKIDSMLPSMQQLINFSSWSTELCPWTKVEVINDN